MHLDNLIQETVTKDLTPTVDEVFVALFLFEYFVFPVGGAHHGPTQASLWKAGPTADTQLLQGKN